MSENAIRLWENARQNLKGPCQSDLNTLIKGQHALEGHILMTGSAMIPGYFYVNLPQG